MWHPLKELCLLCLSNGLVSLSAHLLWGFEFRFTVTMATSTIPLSCFFADHCGCRRLLRSWSVQMTQFGGEETKGKWFYNFSPSSSILPHRCKGETVIGTLNAREFHRAHSRCSSKLAGMLSLFHISAQLQGSLDLMQYDQWLSSSVSIKFHLHWLHPGYSTWLIRTIMVTRVITIQVHAKSAHLGTE